MCRVTITVPQAALAVVLLISVMLVSPAAAQEASPRAYAVLIGIGNYADAKIKPRPRAEADAKALYDLLTDKAYLGVRTENVRLLLGTADPARKSRPASRDNILDALRWLASEAEADDLAIIAFFGQGAPLDAPEGIALEVGCKRLGYFAHDSSAAARGTTAVSAAVIARELDRLRARHVCTLVDVDFTGFTANPPPPEPVLGELPFREFCGAAKPGAFAAPGRAFFGATNGLTPALDLEKHGLFAQVLLDGLKGAADKDGYEPDGVVTVNELHTYLFRELPRRAAQLTPKGQQQFVLRGPDSDFALTSNPEAAPKARARLAKLARLAADGTITAALGEEGRGLLTRMPRLLGQQALRKAYQQLADGTRTPADFQTQRADLLESAKLPRTDAVAFAGKVLEAARYLSANHYHAKSVSRLAAWGLDGLYLRAGELPPPALARRVAQTADLAEADLAELLAEARAGLGRREDLDGHQALDAALHHMLVQLHPRDIYVTPAAVAQARGDNNRLFTGIGVQIRRNVLKDMIEVVTPIRNSPAYKAKVYTGDIITAIVRDMDGFGTPLPTPEVTSTRGMTTEDAVKKLLGNPGTRLKLIVERDGLAKPLEIELTRGKVTTEALFGIQRRPDDSWNHFVDPRNKLAYVRLSSFTGSMAAEFDATLKQLRAAGMKGLILDLRFNQGGLLNQAIATADLLIDDGTILSTKKRGGAGDVIRGKKDGSFLDFPMVCLINAETASGAEIVAACLQDHNRAVLIGERTFGHGHIQNLNDFDGGFFRMTTLLFFRPSGKNIDKLSTPGNPEDVWGVQPDKGFLVPVSPRELSNLRQQLLDQQIIPRPDRPAAPTTGARDRQLERALEHLRRRVER